MAVTLRDVAERANVSTSTVSRILNKKDSRIPISEETRQRVLKAAQEVGYVPNFAARHLAQRQSFALIGVIVPQTSYGVLMNPFYMMILHGIAQHCQEQEFAVTLYFVDTEDEAMVEHLYPRIASIPVHGFILSTVHTNDFLVSRFIEDNIPFVQIGRQSSSEQTSQHFVDVDNYLGAQIATTHLIEKGHSKIATIAAPQTMSAGIDRLRGFTDTMQKAGLPVSTDWIFYGDFDPPSGIEAADFFLDSDDRPTAVFSASDSMATSVIQAAQQRGLHIPEDIAVVGFDDNPDSENITPPLTTIRQPVSEMGETAASLLLQLISADQQPVESKILIPQLIVRESA